MRSARASLVCDRVRAQIALALDGELSQLERVMLEAHVDRCPDCRAYQSQLAGITQVIRETPLEKMERPVVVHRRRRGVGVRMQVGAAAGVALVALGGVSHLVGGNSIRPASFLPPGHTQVKLPSPQQLEREQAILERSPRPGEPVQLEGHVL